MKKYIGELHLEYIKDGLGSFVSLEIDEVAGTTLTMDQVHELENLLANWYSEHWQENRKEEIFRHRSQGAKDGWEIRRAKAVEKVKETFPEFVDTYGQRMPKMEDDA